MHPVKYFFLYFGRSGAPSQNIYFCGARSLQDAGLGTLVVGVLLPKFYVTPSVEQELARFSSQPIDSGGLFMALASEALYGLKNA